MEANRRQQIIDEFHTLYYDNHGQTWANTFWLGVPVQKCPLDLWVYQELIYSLRPDFVIETGTASGGSALYMSSLFDIIDHGQIISIDIEHRPERPRHPRITYLTASSTDPTTVARVRALVPEDANVMVVLDSDHSHAHVSTELQAYAGFVKPGQYLIVEDTNINGFPVVPDFGPGPKEAVDEFLVTHSDFVIDADREKFMMTFNPRGYLKRV